MHKNSLWVVPICSIAKETIKHNKNVWMFILLFSVHNYVIALITRNINGWYKRQGTCLAASLTLNILLIGFRQQSKNILTIFTIPLLSATFDKCENLWGTWKNVRGIMIDWSSKQYCCKAELIDQKLRSIKWFGNIKLWKAGFVDGMWNVR